MPVTPMPLFRGQPSVTIPTPTAPTLGQTANASATLQAGTYYLKYTWVNPNGGESLPSPEVSFTVSAGYQLNASLPAFPTGVTKANIYISAATGTETLQGSTTTTSYSQTTALSTGSALPTVDTTLQAYKVPATLNGTAVKSVTVHGMRLSNNTNAQAVLNGIFVVPSGQTYGSSSPNIWPNQTFNNYELDTDDGKVDLLPGDSIYAQQTTNGAITFYLSGLVVQ